MKNKIFLLLSIVLFLSEFGFTQSKKNLRDIEIKNEFNFVPDTFVNFSSNSTLKLSNKAFFKNNNLLLISGYLLQGFKYVSPVDEFNAVAPFDVRGYSPKDFTSYLSYIDRSQFFQKSINPIK